MAFPAAPTESGSAKIHFLTATGNTAHGWVAVETGTTGTGSNAIGWSGIATHAEGDAKTSPGSITTSAAPIVLVAGYDQTDTHALEMDASGFLKVVLQTGGAAIGKLAANSGVDIGDVDVLTMPTVTETNSAAIKTAVEIVDNAIAGSEMQVDVVTVPAPLSVVGGGTEAAALRVTVANDSTGLVSVDDGGGAVTVDWAGTAPPIGAGTEAAALRVTLATDSTGVLSVDDNGGDLSIDDGGNSITIDGNVGDNGPGFTVVPLQTDGYLLKSTTAAATLHTTTASSYFNVTDVIISISGTANDVILAFGSGTNMTTTILKFHGDVRGGLTHQFRSPPKGAQSDNLNVTLSSATAVAITVMGYETT